MDMKLTVVSNNQNINFCGAKVRLFNSLIYRIDCRSVEYKNRSSESQIDVFLHDINLEGQYQDIDPDMIRNASLTDLYFIIGESKRKDRVENTQVRLLSEKIRDFPVYIPDKDEEGDLVMKNKIDLKCDNTKIHLVI